MYATNELPIIIISLLMATGLSYRTPVNSHPAATSYPTKKAKQPETVNRQMLAGHLPMFADSRSPLKNFSSVSPYSVIDSTAISG